MIELKGKYNKDCKIEKASEDVKIRIMPDTHLGKGIVVGFTMPLTDRVNPFHIGVL